MSNTPSFDNSWYAEMIERFDSSNVSSEVTSRAVLAGFCILAQAIDDLAKAVKGGKIEKP